MCLDGNVYFRFPNKKVNKNYIEKKYQSQTLDVPPYRHKMLEVATINMNRSVKQGFFRIVSKNVLLTPGTVVLRLIFWLICIKNLSQTSTGV